MIGDLAVFEIQSDHPADKELEYQLRVAKVGGRVYTFKVSKRYQNNFAVWGAGVFKAQARVNDGSGWSNWTEEKEIICDSKLIVQIRGPDETSVGKLTVFEAQVVGAVQGVLEYEWRIAKNGRRAYQFKTDKARYRNNFTVWGTGTFKIQGRARTADGWSDWSDERTVVCSAQ